MNFASKLSLYDIVAMVIPGGIILLFLSINMGCCLTIDEYKIDEGLAWLLGIVASYILGIINHVITKLIWSLHRNNTDVIFCALSQTMNEHTKALNALIGDKRRYSRNPLNPFCDYVKFSVCFIIVFAICTFAIIVVSGFCQYGACGTFLIKLLLATLVIVILFFCVPQTRRESDKGILDKYYEAYTYVKQQAKISEVSIIEGQVAFLQAMLLPLFLLSTLDNTKIGYLICCNCCGNCCCCTIRFLIPLVCMSIFPVVFSRMKDTYRIVWEYYEYAKRVESKEEKK